MRRLPPDAREDRDTYPAECVGGPLDGERLNYFIEGAVVPMPGGRYVVRRMWATRSGEPRRVYRYRWEAAA